MYGGIEAGGTKFVVGVGAAETGSIATTRIETGDPEATVAAVAEFLAAHGPLDGLGLASFGPIDVDPASKTYGRILSTPKPGWAGFDLRARLAALTGLNPVVDTDVNAAALAEGRHGAGAGARDLAYVTIGTGIGVGLFVGGRTVHGIAHPEMGHIRPRRHPAHDGFAGSCPYHGDCLEGLAAGSAIEAAWGASLDELPPDHPAWAAETDYVAQLCATLILTLAPAKIVLGGGVMRQQALFAPIRAAVAEQLAGYGVGVDRASLEDRIVAPGCIEPPGLMGAYLLAAQ